MAGIAQAKSEFSRGGIVFRILVVAVAICLINGSGLARAQGLGGASPAPSAISAIWANDGGDKVLAEERRASGGQSIAPAHGIVNSVWDGKQVNVFAARNEMVSFNLVIESAAGAKDIRVAFDTLLGPGGAMITSKPAQGDGVFNYVGRDIELFQVRYLPVKGVSMFGYDTYDERWIPSKIRRPFKVVRYGSSGRTEPLPGKDKWVDRPGAGKHFPDIAVPIEAARTLAVPAGGNQSVWCDIYVPKTSPPGVYAGTLTVIEGAGASRSIPITLRVRDFQLPDTPSATAIVPFGGYDLAERFLGSEMRFTEPGSSGYPRLLSVAQRFAQMIHRHRIVPMADENGGVAPPRPETIERLKGTLYTGARGYDGPGQGAGDNLFVIGPYGSWKWKKGDQAEFNRMSDAWMVWFAANAPKTPRFLYLTDEPKLGDPAVMREITGWLDKLAANPGPGRNLPTFITVPLPEIRAKLPTINIAASWYAVAQTEQYQRAFDQHISASPRNQFWQYNGKRPASGSFTIEDDGVALRTIQWAAAKKGISGWFYWESNYYDDYQNGAGKVDVWRQANTFGKAARVDPVMGETSGAYSNGEGVLIYPGIDRVFPDTPAPGLNGPIASLRLKHWRRGIQDSDYIALARQKDPAATKRIVDRMVPKVLWEVGVHTMSDPSWQVGGMGEGLGWSTNPDDWEKARAELADIIERK